MVDANGGANGDGLVLANDVSVVRQFVLGNLVPVNSTQAARADVNGVCGDGSINAADITLVRQYSLGSLIPSTNCNPNIASIVFEPKEDLLFAVIIAGGFQQFGHHRYLY